MPLVSDYRLAKITWIITILRSRLQPASVHQYGCIPSVLMYFMAYAGTVAFHFLHIVLGHYWQILSMQTKSEVKRLAYKHDISWCPCFLSYWSCLAGIDAGWFCW
jgi:hypothetical protein